MISGWQWNFERSSPELRPAAEEARGEKEKLDQEVGGRRHQQRQQGLARHGGTTLWTGSLKIPVWTYVLSDTSNYLKGLVIASGGYWIIFGNLWVEEYTL